MNKLKHTNIFQSFSNLKKTPECSSVISNPLKGRFNSLPNEIIILILSQSILSVRTLIDMMKISKRMFDLCLYVLVRYIFPSYSIEATIDQEGHGRSVTHFSFQSVEAESLCLSFAVKFPFARRYYTNKEVPMIRRMIIKGLCNSHGLCARQCEEKAKRIPLPSAMVANTKIMIETKNRRIGKVQKEGIHNVQVSRLFPVSRLAWKLGYQIDRKVKKEYTLTPLYLDIQFSYFIQLIQDKKKFV